MPTIDVLLLIVILLSAVMGLFRGLIKEVLSLLTWLAAFLLAMYVSPRLAEAYVDSLGGFAAARVVLFIAIFILTLIAASIAQWFIAKLVHSTGLSGTDRLLGFLFGSARGVIVCIVTLIGLRGFTGDSQWWTDSALIPAFMAFEGDVLALMGYAREAVIGLSNEVEQRI